MTSSLADDPRHPDTLRRGLVTIGALVVLFAGTHIPAPGLSADLLRRIPLGPPLGRLSIFGLGVTPIVFARVILELLRLTIPPLGRWAARPDQAGRWADLGRALALTLAGLQAYGLALTFEDTAGFASEAGLAFRLGIVATAIGATALLLALIDLIARHGVGDGLLILLAVPFVAGAPQTIALLVELGRTGAIPAATPVELAALILLAVTLLVASSFSGEGATGGTQSRLARAQLDIWPPLLAVSVLAPLGAAMGYLLGSAGLPSRSGLASAHILALAGLIALFAALRARAGARPPNLWASTLAEIAVCAGAALFAFGFGISSEAGGFWIVCATAAALSCFSRSVRF